MTTVATAERVTAALPAYRQLAELCDLEGWRLQLARYGTDCAACRGHGAYVTPGAHLTRMVVEQGHVLDCFPCLGIDPVLVLELWTGNGAPATRRCEPTVDDAAAALLVHAHHLRYLADRAARYGE